MQDVSVEIKLGKVSGGMFGELHFQLSIAADGKGSLDIHALDPSNNYRRNGILVRLGAQGLADFREIIQRIDEVLRSAHHSGQLRQLAP
jgi:hypothetical protein